MLTNSVTRSEYKALNIALYRVVGITLKGERDAITVWSIVTNACASVGRHSPVRDSEDFAMLLVWARNTWAEQAAA